MSFEIGQRVGAFTSFGVIIGNVEEVFAGGWFAVRGDDNFIVEARKKFIFPVWEGNYTHKDLLKLAMSLDVNRYNYLANDLRELHKDFMSVEELIGVHSRLIDVKPYLKKSREDFGACSHIDKFLDWAAHGFQGETRCG